jgi:ATP-binding cassette subfamily B protein
MKTDELNNSLLDFAETLLDENHTLSIRMKGYSMYPTLKAGDIGMLDKCSPEELKIGDIVVFKAHDKLIAHRLIEVFHKDEVRMFMTKGDKNCYKDAPFTDEMLMGKITSFQRGNRTIKTDSRRMKFQRFLSLRVPNLTIPFYNVFLRLNNRFVSLKSGTHSLKQNLSVIIPSSGKEIGINAIISVLQGVVPFVIIVLVKKLIDFLTKTQALTESQYYRFISLLIFTALIFLLSGILSEFRAYFSEKLSQSITRQIYIKLHRKHASLDLSHYENPAEQDKIHRAVQEASFRPIKIINELLTALKSVAASLFLVGIFFTIRWYLVVLMLIAIVPGVWVRLKFSRKQYKLKESQSTREREMYYYNRILTGFPFAKELKLFGFSHFFLHRFSKTQDSLFDEKISLQKSELRFEVLAQLFAVILIFFSLGYVSYLKISGFISIGTVVLFFFAFQRGYQVLNDLFMSVTRIVEDNTYLNDFRAFLNLPVQSDRKEAEIPPFSLKKEIRVEKLSFRYETSKRDALKSVNISIPYGKTVAFVGANGSGKTTLIKLLCGFYQPDAGKILFDGIDSTRIGQKVICENISAVFQDFALYNLPAIENLRLGDISLPFDLERAKKAAQAAGIDEVFRQLPEGYNTLLGNLFKGGEELSIGQWQKIAIARAFYRDAPLILMDEPSSALDADSELQIIAGLKKLSKDKTAVIVSHRLTTVEWADLIYFFQEGEVVESGSHHELMQLKGKYYSLFQTANKRLKDS